MALSLDEALGMSLADEADESIHVDVNTRQITIPESQQLFGVESDADVEVKHIVIDGRYADGTDLSTFTFRINYQNANPDTTNNKGTYLVTSLKVNEDSIEFDWVIGRKVVAYKGVVAFIVRAEIVNSDGIIQNEWNSTLGKGATLEGLEVSEFDFGDDIVRQLASILSDVNAAQASAKASADEAYKSKTEVVALGKEQQAAIEKKGKDALASIPDDYTQVSNDVSQLKEVTASLRDGKISKFYASSQGDTNLPDSDDGRIMDLKLYGRGEQRQYTGYNTIKPFDDASGTESGVKWTRKNGVLTMSGTCTTTGAVISIGATTKAFDANKSKGIYETTGSFAKTVQYDFDAMVASDKNSYAIEAGKNIRLYMYEGTDYTGTLAVALADVSVSQTTFEPYVGGIPSPNPEYPQEIKSVVKPVVKVTGKNLVGKLLPGVIAWDSGNYRNTEVGYACTGFIPVKPGEIYTISNGTGGAERWYYSSDKKPVNHMPAGANITVTIPDGIAYMRVSCYVDNKYKFQIEKGSTATAYEPYTEQTVTLPYTLNAIPVSSGGNVTIDGQQYIADYVDVERGKLVRMTDSKAIDGSEDWKITDESIPTQKRFGAPFYTSLSYAGFCTKLVNAGKLIIGSDNAYSVYGSWIDVRYTACETVDAFKSFLAQQKADGDPVKILFGLTTPTEIDLTTEEIAAFKALVSYYPTTNVSTTSDQLDGYTVFNYPISLANGWNYVKQQLGDTRDYLYGIDLMTAEAYVNSEYAAALAEIEV